MDFKVKVSHSLDVYDTDKCKDVDEVTVLKKWAIRNAKLMIYLSILTTAALLIVCSMDDTVYRSTEQEDSGSFNVCMSEICVKESARLLEGMDRSVDPCEDFYEFTCGGWMKRHKVVREWDTVNLDTEDTQLRLLNKINEMISPPIANNDTRLMKLLKKMFRSCLDTKSIRRKGTKPLSEFLRRVGGWPVVEGSKWNESNFDLVDLFRRFKKYGGELTSLMPVNVDVYNKSKFILAVVPDTPYISFLDFSTTLDLVINLGANNQTAPNELRAMLDFHNAILQFLPTNYTTNQTVTFKELKELTPKFEWPKYLEAITHKSFADNEQILIYEKTVTGISSLVEKVDKRTLANYLVWKTVSTVYMEFIYTKGRNKNIFAIRRSPRIDSGVLNERCLYCSAVATVYQYVLLAHFYIPHYSQNIVRNTVRKMTDSIQKQLFKAIETSDWLTNKTKQFALEKGRAMKFQIAYPDEITNDKLMERLFANYTLSEKHFFENIMECRRWISDFRLRLLQQPFTRVPFERFARVLFDINAYYSPARNAISMPMALLEGFYFYNDRPTYMNFGALGATIGHEMTHGFDNTGRKYDKEGWFKNWWDEESLKNFKKKTQCMIDQYSNYTYPELGLSVNGELTLGENIADNGGLLQAYLAYLEYTAKHGEDSHLLQLNYTQKQMFWISFGYSWCEKYTETTLKDQLEDVHTPMPFRVNGAVSNMEEFSKDFKCPLGSPMNPKKKCKVW